MGQTFSSLSQAPLFKQFITTLEYVNSYITKIPFTIVHLASKLLPILFPNSRARLIGVHALNISIRSLLPLSTISTLYIAYRIYTSQPVDVTDLPHHIRALDYALLIYTPLEIVFFIYECYVANKLQTLSTPPDTTLEERSEIQNKLMNAIHLLHDYTPVENDVAIGVDTTPDTTFNERLNSMDNEADAVQPHKHSSTEKIVTLVNGKKLREREWDCRRYLTGWYLGCNIDDIYYENIAEFLCVGGMNKKLQECTPEERNEVYEQTNRLIRGNDTFARSDNYVQQGYNKNVRFICPPYDTIEWQHRPAIIYAGIAAIHYGSEFVLRSMGYTKHCITIPADRNEVSDIHSNTDKDLYFWHRKPVYHSSNNDSSDDTIELGDEQSDIPIVFCHGIGLGLTPYLGFIKQLPYCNQHNTDPSKRNHNEREVFLIEFEHVSMKRVHRIPSEREIAHAVALMLSLPAGQKHQRNMSLKQVYKKQHSSMCRPAVFIGHSYGTLSLAWFVKYHPSMIGRLVFIDPICFLLFTHELSYKFFHRKPVSAMQNILDYWVARELYIGNTLTRHMRWTESACFKEDLLSLRRHKCIPFTQSNSSNMDMIGAPKLLRRDSTSDSFRVSDWNDDNNGNKQPLLGHSHTDDDLHSTLNQNKKVKTIVYLSDNDAIVGSQSVYTYLTTQLQDDVKSTDNTIEVNWFKNFEHAQFLFNNDAQIQVCQSIVD